MYNHDLRVVFTRLSSNISCRITECCVASDGYPPVGNSLSSVRVVARWVFMDLSLQNVETHDRTIRLLQKTEGPIDCEGEQCLNDICSEHCPDKDCEGDSQCRDMSIRETRRTMRNAQRECE